MNEFIKCTKCNEFHWTDEPCPEIYLISDPDYLDKEKPFHAWSFDDAAGRYAKFRELASTVDSLMFSVKDKTGLAKVYQVKCEVQLYYVIKENNASPVNYVPGA